MISSAIETIWTIVLTLPEKPAGITRCSAAAKLRSEVTANSRAMITTTIQAGTTVWPLLWSISTSEMNAAEIRILSAAGSSSVPRRVTS